MNVQILRAKDGSGRRWLLVEGHGACVELKAGPELAKPAASPKPKKRVKKWDGF
jgi:hypothetical protein